MKPGHSSPISDDNAVPVTAPGGEQRDHQPRPAPGDGAVQRIAGAQVLPLGEHHDRRQRDRKAHQRDVHRKRHRLDLTSLEQVSWLIGADSSARARHATEMAQRDVVRTLRV